jgi:hypothetical protein
MIAIRCSPYSFVDVFQPVRVFKGQNGVPKVDTVFPKVRVAFAIVLFVLHVQDTAGYE